MNKATWFVAITIVFVGICVTRTGTREIPAADVTPIPTETVGDTVRGAMQAKLVHSKSILNGLVTRDFSMIKAAATKMKKVSLSAPEHIEGDKIDNEVYHHFRLEFLRISSLMEKMAKDENLEGAAFAYQSLTANCLACHSYLDGSSAR